MLNLQNKSFLFFCPTTHSAGIKSVTTAFTEFRPEPQIMYINSKTKAQIEYNLKNNGYNNIFIHIMLA